jgi:catechol 2,3-dioxygenase-like lactoylglutathione lyase family enzyme
MQQIAPLEVGLVVRDLDRMLRFYVDVLGCTEVRRADIPAALSRAIATAPEGYVNVWLRTPNGEVIKLVRPPSAPVLPGAAAYSSERGGFAYLTFYCSDLAGILAKALANGALERSDAAARTGAFGVKLVFFADPEGNVVELVEPI